MAADKRLCLNCGKTIQGRVDKKFCDDQCRNNHNYQQTAAHTNLIRQVNYSLRKNRNILEMMIPEGEETVKTSKMRLLREGFQFRYITHVYETKKGKVYYFCYDFGYLPLDEDWYLLVRMNYSF